MEKLKTRIENKYGRTFESYHHLHEWSINNIADFWKELWDYFKIVAHKPYKEVLAKTGPGILDYEWFPGALFNLAENLLRIRDDRVALIFADECESEEVVTYSQIFEEVKLYAAAFKRQGLRKGDRLACYMSSRKEAVFAFLAAASIGAIFGGPLPFYGAKVAANLIRFIDPKILIIIDYFIYDGKHFNLLENLKIISEINSLEKIIVVTTSKSEFHSDLSSIPNSVHLEEFLERGRDSDGVPDLVFEPLPANYPSTISFTSGTTGLPKAPVHAAIRLLPLLRDIVFHLDMNSSDTIYVCAAPGRIIWHLFLPCLAIGAKVLFFSGSPAAASVNFWNVLSRYGVTLASMVPRHLDMLHHRNILPDATSTLDKFKGIVYGSTSLRRETDEYIRKLINKDVFIASWYGCTECHGAFTAFCFNMPLHFRENQVLALGLDLRCYGKNGYSVTGERGESVITSPTPSFPLYLWKDDDNIRLKKEYLSKNYGAWTVGDVCCIKLETSGLVVIGRSDDEIKVNGERIAANDIYAAIEKIPYIQDFACIQQDSTDGRSRAVLFLKMKETELNQQMKNEILSTIAKHVSIAPEIIIPVPDIPYNLNGKRMESLIRKLVATNIISEDTNIKNQECLRYYCNIPELLQYNKKCLFSSF